MSARLRWADPETAALYFALRDMAPELAGLIYCRSMPEARLATLLDWSELVGTKDGSDAFAIDRLRDVLPALVTAFVASHTYRPADGDIVELYDAGCGSVVGRVLPMTALIAIALHGEDGRALAEAAQADLAGTLGRIHALMIGR